MYCFLNPMDYCPIYSVDSVKVEELWLILSVVKLIRNDIANKNAVSIIFDLERAYATTWKYWILKHLFDMGSKSKLPICIRIFYLKDNLRSKLIQLILTFMNKRWEFPREASPLLHCFKWNSFPKILNDNIEDSLYVVGFLIWYRSKNMNIIERQWQLCINKIEK